MTFEKSQRRKSSEFVADLQQGKKTQRNERQKNRKLSLCEFVQLVPNTAEDEKNLVVSVYFPRRKRFPLVCLLDLVFPLNCVSWNGLI